MCVCGEMWLSDRNMPHGTADSFGVLMPSTLPGPWDMPTFLLGGEPVPAL